MRFASVLAAWWGFWTSAGLAHAGEVTLEPGPNSVCVRINGEVFTVLNTSKDWKKPFLYPVAAPGGIQHLSEDVKQPIGEEGLPGSRVMVCKEDAELRLSDSTGKLKLGEIIDVRSIKRPLLWVPDLNGWVHERDVAPLGSVVTRVIQQAPKKDLDRKHPLYYDHPHHKGIWNTIDEVNGIKFWNEDATVRNISVTIDQAQGESAQLTMVNHWLSPDGSPLVKETTKLRFMADHSLVADIDFAAVDKAVTFGDTKEGLFAIRLPNSMRENAGGGPVANADGLTSTMNCWGKTSPWVDYAGPVGHRKLAVTLMDWSGAFRKSRYHVRDYGLFSINPFGPKSYTNGAEPESPVTIEPGKSIQLRYGVSVREFVDHQGAAEAYKRFESLP